MVACINTSVLSESPHSTLRGMRLGMATGVDVAGETVSSVETRVGKAVGVSVNVAVCSETAVSVGLTSTAWAVGDSLRLHPTVTTMVVKTMVTRIHLFAACISRVASSWADRLTSGHTLSNKKCSNPCEGSTLHRCFKNEAQDGLAEGTVRVRQYDVSHKPPSQPLMTPRGRRRATRRHSPAVSQTRTTSAMSL